MTLRAACNSCLILLLLACAATTVPATQPDRSSPAAAYQALLDAIARDDTDAVADAVALPIELHGQNRQLMAERLVVGSKLVWAIQKRFDPRVTSQACWWGNLTYVLPIDQTEFRATAGPRDDDPRPRRVAMKQVGPIWKLDKTHAIVALLACELDDAPTMQPLDRKVLADLEAGRITDSQALLKAVLPPAGPVPPTTSPTDRAAPANVPAAIDAAVASGDVNAVVDCFESSDAAFTDSLRGMAERAIVDQQLDKAFHAKFGSQQGDRLSKESGFNFNRLTGMYGNVQWSIDGDLARGIRDGRQYDPALRMRRRDGVWRVQYPRNNIDGVVPPDEKARLQNDTSQAQLAAFRDILTHLDRYPDPGSMTDALFKARAAVPASSPKEPPPPSQAERLARMKDDLKKGEDRFAADRAKLSPHEQAMAEISFSFQRQLIAAGAPEFLPPGMYIADNDAGGAYAQARSRRIVAGMKLAKSVDRQIGGGHGEGWLKELTIVNAADDFMTLAMSDWTVTGDRAVGKLPNDVKFWLPDLRKIGDDWKIDISAETDNQPAAAAAQRADTETRSIESITQQVDELKLKTLADVNAAVSAAGIRGTGKAE